MFNPVDQPISLLKLLNICFNNFLVQSQVLLLCIYNVTDFDTVRIRVHVHCAIWPFLCMPVHGGQVIEILTQAFLL